MKQHKIAAASTAILAATLALSGCAQPPRQTSSAAQWFASTSMTVDAQALGARKPGTVADIRPAVRYVFQKTPQCRLEPKALNALAHLDVGQWILRKTSPCYVTHTGQVLTIDLDSGKVVRIEQFDQPEIVTGDRVWVGGPTGFVEKIAPGSGRPIACQPHEDASKKTQAAVHMPWLAPSAMPGSITFPASAPAPAMNGSAYGDGEH